MRGRATESGKPWTVSRGAPTRTGLPWLWALTLGGALAACATVPRKAAQPVAELEGTVLELRATNAGYLRRMEEMENRIFILEDQLDSRRIASEQRAPATLPTRVLGADSTLRALPAISSPFPGIPAPSPAANQGPIETTIFAEHDVEYGGDAAQPRTSRAKRSGSSRRRPVLRLSARKTESVVASLTPEPIPEVRPVAFGGGGPIRPLKLYRESLRTLQAGRPDAALGGFVRFLAENPDHDYADNAQYWLGECHYQQRQFRAAERAFRLVVERYPRGNKVPDAMLKLGLTLQALADEQGGRAVLESLARAFPKHEAARAAAARLAHPGPEPAATLGTILPAVPVFATPVGGHAQAFTASGEVRR